ncbi:alpha/beta fold hydrolase [Amycolatopsis ultiminotia]|uniref:Alpha/beta fold hydrolase n=1 Tax=Amycolatopsis ultiminotia TaxID=543629 RepID=A0ABP6V0Z7_9PSEU
MPTDAPVRRYPARDGLELAYRELGSGHPVLLVHGLLGSADLWVRCGLAEALAARGFRVLMPDLRGHRDSPRPHDPARYPPDVLADDGLALAEHLALGRYFLGGFSLGGRIVLRMLARGARPVRAFIGGQGLDAVRRGGGGARIRRVLTTLAAGHRPEAGTPDAEIAYWITRLGNDPRALLGVESSLVPTTDAELARISTPTLVAVGSADTDHASAGQLAGLLPDATFNQVPGEHYPSASAPEFREAVLEFFGRDVPRRQG